MCVILLLKEAEKIYGKHMEAWACFAKDIWPVFLAGLPTTWPKFLSSKGYNSYWAESVTKFASVKAIFLENSNVRVGVIDVIDEGNIGAFC